MSSSPVLPALVDLPVGLLPAPAECTRAEKASLVAELASVMDGRSRQGLRHLLLPILTLAVWAVMGGATSFAAIADHAVDVDVDLAEVIGLSHPRWGYPHAGTVRRALIKVDLPSLEAALRRWAIRRAAARAAQRAAGGRRPGWLPGSVRALRSVFALDGKTAKGSTHPEIDPATGVVTRRQAAFVAVTDLASGVTVTQTPIIAGDEVAAAATALSDLSGGVDLAGCTFTFDARHTVRATATQILGYGAHYIARVRANTPTLHDLLAGQDWVPVPTSRTCDRGSARIESRSIKVLNLDARRLAQLREVFPGATQMIRVVRRRTTLTGQRVPRPRTATKGKKDGKRKKVKITETVYYVTSLDFTQAQPVELAAWIRGHWRIENQLHHVRDVTFSEDASRVRTGSGPQIMAAIRNTVISLARLDGSTNIARTTRRWNRRNADALSVLLDA